MSYGKNINIAIKDQVNLINFWVVLLMLIIVCE